MTTEITRAQPAQPAQPTLTPEQKIAQDTVAQMLGASVESFGDIVRALLCDLGRTSNGFDAIGWLGPTPGILDQEHTYRIAVEQLTWWEDFLRPLVNPRLLSEDHAQERRHAIAERARVRLLARQQALDAHRAAVNEALTDPALSEERRGQLHAIAADPDSTAWWIDPEQHIAAALGALPPLPTLVPIIAAALDPSHNFSGARAIDQLRQDPMLGPRAAQLEAGLIQLLTASMGLTATQATPHATILTGMFWLALRRALARGTHGLSASIALVSSTEEAPLQEQFTRELLMSWFAYLQTIPPPSRRPSLAQRLRRMLGLSTPPPETARQLTDKKR